MGGHEPTRTDGDVEPQPQDADLVDGGHAGLHGARGREGGAAVPVVLRELRCALRVDFVELREPPLLLHFYEVE